MHKTIYIVRHGETEYNRLGVVQGSGVDAHLNEYGKLQAAALFEWYKQVPFEVVFTSRLRRTHQTAWPFIEQGKPWEQWEELNEMNWGIFEGRPSSQSMHEAYKKVKERWNAGNYDARLEGAESAAELGERIGRFIDHLKQRQEQHILVCSHGRAMCALVCLLKQWPLSEMNNLKHDNTGLWKAHFDGQQFHFELENDTRHLQLLKEERFLTR